LNRKGAFGKSPSVSRFDWYTFSPDMRPPDLLDLNEVLQNPGKKISVEVSTDLDNDPDAKLLQPMTGCLEVVSTGNLLLLTGSFSAKLILDCARCGSPIEVPIQFEVDEQFPVEGVAACYGLNDQARIVADEPFPLFEGNGLLTDAFLRQELLVAAPIQPLCQYGWDGPCPNASFVRLSKAESALGAALKQRAELEAPPAKEGKGSPK
jgi:uncharacterized metal-binding protein YceD (DUF177 family)